MGALKLQAMNGALVEVQGYGKAGKPVCKVEVLNRPEHPPFLNALKRQDRYVLAHCLLACTHMIRMDNYMPHNVAQRKVKMSSKSLVRILQGAHFEGPGKVGKVADVSHRCL